MAVISSERAGLQDMLHGAAGALKYDAGTDPSGRLLLLGRWTWFDADGDPGLRVLPRLATTASPRLKRDHRTAEELRAGWVRPIHDAFMTSRLICDWAVQQLHEIGQDRVMPKVIAQMLAERAEVKFPEFDRAIRKLVQARDRLNEVRATLAREAVAVEDQSTFATMLQIDSITAPDDDDKSDAAQLRSEATKAMTSAVFDVAICQSLRPLDETDKQLLIERRALPKSLDDPRVLAAIFRSPRPLIPLTDEEMQAAAEMGFAKNWPLTAKVADAVAEMIDETRVVAAQAACELGGMLDRMRPHDIFKRIAGGLWLLEQRALHDEAAAVALRGGLGVRGPVEVFA